MVVEAEIDSDIYSYVCVRRKGFGSQYVVPDCHIISTNDSSPSFQSNQVARRAAPTDRLEKNLGEGKKPKGHVCCLLLFATTWNEKGHACILILGRLAGRGDT
jgi:hypothetical protein